MLPGGLRARGWQRGPGDSLQPGRVVWGRAQLPSAHEDTCLWVVKSPHHITCKPIQWCPRGCRSSERSRFEAWFSAIIPEVA